MTFRIYYSDGSIVSGENREDWIKAPDTGVQVVVNLKPGGLTGWTYIVNEENKPVCGRQLYTGTDEYNPFGFGIKYGELIKTKAYFAIWNRACGDE